MQTPNEQEDATAKLPRWQQDEIAACISISEWLRLVDDAAVNKGVPEFRLACAIQEANPYETPEGPGWPIWRVAARYFIGKPKECREYMAKLKLAIENKRKHEGRPRRGRSKKGAQE